MRRPDCSRPDSRCLPATAVSGSIRTRSRGRRAWASEPSISTLRTSTLSCARSSSGPSTACVPRDRRRSRLRGPTSTCRSTPRSRLRSPSRGPTPRPTASASAASERRPPPGPHRLRVDARPRDRARSAAALRPARSRARRGPRRPGLSDDGVGTAALVARGSRARPRAGARRNAHARPSRPGGPARSPGRVVRRARGPVPTARRVETGPGERGTPSAARPPLNADARSVPCARPARAAPARAGTPRRARRRSSASSGSRSSAGSTSTRA